MRLWRQLALLACAAVCVHVGSFYLQAIRCSAAVGLDSETGEGSLRALVVSDIHLLGNRRRTWIERKWIDWQVRLASSAAVTVHQPDLVLVLGDQFDEGGLPTASMDWKSYVSRLLQSLPSFATTQTLYMIGNHDASFGRFMQPAEVQRYERSFGLSNFITYVQGHAIIGLNTMALDKDAAHEDVKAQARSFLDTIDLNVVRGKTTGKIILLTHVPLYREDDMRCGAQRLKEQGHVTYEHPSFQYREHHHVLSRELSTELLGMLQPDLVLSGHTHAWCSYQHPTGSSEFTIPTFTWGQRPDPSYAVLQLTSSVLDVTPCALPKEPHIFLLYAAAIAIAVFKTLLSCCSRPPKAKAKAN